MSQKELISILEISKSLYSEYEQEIKIMPIKHLNKLSDYLHLSIDYIFGLTSLKNYNNETLTTNLEKMGIRLKKFRKSHNLTQEKLAKIIGCKSSNISDYERGKYLIPTIILYRICKKYNISADYLLGKTNFPKYLNK